MIHGQFSQHSANVNIVTPYNTIVSTYIMNVSKNEVVLKLCKKY